MLGTNVSTQEKTDAEITREMCSLVHHLYVRPGMYKNIGKKYLRVASQKDSSLQAFAF